MKFGGIVVAPIDVPCTCLKYVTHYHAQHLFFGLNSYTAIKFSVGNFRDDDVPMEFIPLAGRERTHLITTTYNIIGI